MIVGGGVVPRAGARDWDPATQIGPTQRFERVVDGGERDARTARILHELVQLLCGGMRVGARERLVDLDPLLGAAETSLGKERSDLVNG